MRKSDEYYDDRWRGYLSKMDRSRLENLAAYYRKMLNMVEEYIAKLP